MIPDTNAELLEAINALLKTAHRYCSTPMCRTIEAACTQALIQQRLFRQEA